MINIFFQWVIGKVDGHRQMFSLLQSKNANLTDAGEELAKLMTSEFKNICLLEK